MIRLKSDPRLFMKKFNNNKICSPRSNSKKANEANRDANSGNKTTDNTDTKRVDKKKFTYFLRHTKYAATSPHQYTTHIQASTLGHPTLVLGNAVPLDDKEHGRGKQQNANN